MAIDKAVDSAKLNGAMTATANAIRTAGGTTGDIAWDQNTGFASAVSELGGGFYPSLLITAPTGHTITATNGVDTVTLSEISEGQYWGEVTDYGEWTVSGDGGGDGPTLTITEVAEYRGEVVYISTTFADNDWKIIASVGSAGNGANYWSIGDTHPVTLNGTVGITTYANASYHVFIAHFNYKGQNGIYLMGFMDPTTSNVLGLCDANYNNYKQDGTKTYNMNHWGNGSGNYSTNFGGWKGCDLRYDILGSTNKQPSGYGSTATTSRVGYDPENYDIVNSPVSNTLMAVLPSALRQNMKPFTVYTDNVGNKSTAAANVTASVDYIVLPAEYEIFGTTVDYANVKEPAQQKQLKFYELGNSKITYKDTDTATAVNRWERSPSRSDAYTFAWVNTDGSSRGSLSRQSSALTPLLCVA